MLAEKFILVLETIRTSYSLPLTRTTASYHHPLRVSAGCRESTWMVQNIAGCRRAIDARALGILKIMRFVLAILVALSMSSAAFAEEYEKGPNGGLMLDVAGIDAELMTSGNTVTFNIFIPNTAKPVPTDGFTAAALIINGSSRETLSLAPQGENSLKGEAKTPIAVGATITLTIKTAEGKSGQVRFKVGGR